MTGETAGILLLSAMVAIGAVQALGAAIARPYYRRALMLLTAANAVPAMTADDLRSLRRDAYEMTAGWLLPAAALTAPLWCLFLLASAIRDAVRFRNKSHEEMLAMARADLDRAEALHDTAPAHSAAYLPVSANLSDQLMRGIILSHPISSVIVLVFLLPSIAVFWLTGAGQAAWDRFRAIGERVVHAISSARAALVR